MKKSLRELAVVQYGRSPNDVRADDGNYPIYGSGGLVGYAAEQLFSQSGIVVARKGTLDKPSYVEDGYWVIDTAYAVLPQTGVFAKWLYYCLADFDLKKLNEATGVPSISRDYLYRIKFFTPKYEQQQKIAKILTTVDNLIDKTQALINKYSAIKQGMMADLFTRGIDLSGTTASNPNYGQLRPSVEDKPELYKSSELGMTPKDWEVCHLSSIAEKITSGSRDWASHYADEGDLFVRISNLTREHINFRWKSVKYVNIGNGSEGERTRLEAGDILISITADLGIIGVVPATFGRAFINQHTALIRLNKVVVNSRYLGHFLQSYIGQYQFEKFNDTGAKAGLNLPTLGSLQCLLPSIVEQERFAVIIDQIDMQIAVFKGEVIKYQNQKKGLMQDLLTGKVRVN
ncbi:MAG: type I restriction enzyme S subunit [Phenylobacterium sp.]|jgi:type I restriction enzyme S subunit